MLRRDVREVLLATCGSLMSLKVSFALPSLGLVTLAWTLEDVLTRGVALKDTTVGEYLLFLCLVNNSEHFSLLVHVSSVADDKFIELLFEDNSVVGVVDIGVATVFGNRTLFESFAFLDGVSFFRPKLDDDPGAFGSCKYLV